MPFINPSLLNLLTDYLPQGVSVHILPDVPQIIPYVVLPAAQARPCWQTVHTHRTQLGLLPVIVEETTEEEFRLNGSPPVQSTTDPGWLQRRLAATTHIDPVAWLATATERVADQADDTLEPDLWHRSTNLTSTIIAPDTNAHYVRLAFIPATNAWQVPLYLQFGGYNACPSPHEHAAILKYWDQEYSLHCVVCSGDSLEVFVDQRPQTPDAARSLAEQQFAYNPDIVWQDAGSIERLAARLYQSSTWSFWWD